MRSFNVLNVCSLALLLAWVGVVQPAQAAIIGSPYVSSRTLTSRTFKLSYSARSSYTQIYIDADSLASTGYSVGGIGAEYLLENSTLYKKTAGSSPRTWAWTKIRKVLLMKGATLATWSGVLNSDLGGIIRFKMIARSGSLVSSTVPVVETALVAESSPIPSVSLSPVPSPVIVPVPVVVASPTSAPAPVVIPSSIPVVVVPPSSSMITVWPASTSTIFTNPERGFHNYEGVSTSSSTHASNLAAGSTLAIAVVKLDAYIGSASLPASFLTEYTNMFTQARIAGVKMILLHRYHTVHDFNSDPSEAQMLTHIAQLTPIITANSDVVYTLHGGFIGAYGEWYYTQHSVSVRRNILNALMSQIPSSLTIALRTPGFKIDLFNMTGPNVAGVNAELSKRVGHHNDCFLASSSDEGTDGGYNLSGDWRDFIGSENRQLSIPVGGESCGVSSYSGCANALAQLERMGFSYLNIDYHPDVLNGWRTGGCFDEINRRLGYRFELNQFSIPSSVSKAAAFNVNMMIKNVGFSGMVQTRPVKLVFFNASNSYTVDVASDPRKWLPGTKDITQAVSLASTGIPVGSYNVAIWMPDSNSGLQSRPVYSVRFANDGWDSVKGWNVIKNGSSNLSVNVSN